MVKTHDASADALSQRRILHMRTAMSSPSTSLACRTADCLTYSTEDDHIRRSLVLVLTVEVDRYAARGSSESVTEVVKQVIC